jgi:hypothetical protein
MKWRKLLSLTMGNLPSHANVRVQAFGSVSLDGGAHWQWLKPEAVGKRLLRTSSSTELVDRSKIEPEEWNEIPYKIFLHPMAFQTKEKPEDHVLQSRGMTLHYRPRASEFQDGAKEGGSNREKGVDMALGLRALTDAMALRQNQPDRKLCFYFYGGDSDFLPLYERLFELNVHVVVYGWAEGTNASVKRLQNPLFRFEELDKNVGHFTSLWPHQTVKMWTVSSEECMDPKMNEKLMLEIINKRIQLRFPHEQLYGTIAWNRAELQCYLRLYIRTSAHLASVDQAAYEEEVLAGFRECLLPKLPKRWQDFEQKFQLLDYSPLHNALKQKKEEVARLSQLAKTNLEEASLQASDMLEETARQLPLTASSQSWGAYDDHTEGLTHVQASPEGDLVNQMRESID